MPLHQLTCVTIGVPDVGAVAAYYAEFGLTDLGDGSLATIDGGRQLRIAPAPTRRLIDLTVGVDDPDDLDRIGAGLAGIGLSAVREGDAVHAGEPVAGFLANVEISPRVEQPFAPPTPYNGPGRPERTEERAPGVLRDEPVRPLRLGHVVVGSVDYAATSRFFIEGLGFKASDYIKDAGVFLRCSTEHHNVLVVSSPVNFLHHTSWQVEDIDEIGRGACAMLERHPERHVWGLGRHYSGSSFFWYLKDPAGNFAEYYCDMDCIIDDQLWTPETLDTAGSLLSWGPPLPPSFLQPDDLAELMAGSHSVA